MYRFTKKGDSLLWLRDILTKLPDDDYIVKRYDPIRNTSQNSLYWVLLGYVEKQTWNDSDDLHEFMKKKFLKGKRKMVKLWGRRNYILKEKTTKTLSRKRFSEYFEQVERFFAEVWYVLPPHDTPEFHNLYETYAR